MRLLVTRPEPDGERTAAVLRRRGHEVLLAPMLRMQAVDFVLADDAYGAVVMTSANAARAIAAHPDRAKLTALAAFTVGRHTADAARAVGFRDVHSADGDKDDLVRLLAARGAGAHGPLLYLAGEDRSGDLDLDLNLGLNLGHGPVRTVVVYRAVKADDLPPGIQAALTQRQLDGVLHFSRRSAQSYLDCARGAGMLESALAPVHYCLSQQVSLPLAAAGAAGIRVAPRPEEAALLDLVIS
jgi:uroporphyrinogen-III synthase